MACHFFLQIPDRRGGGPRLDFGGMPPPGHDSKFPDGFVRNPDGSWFCRSPRHIVGPNGPVTTTPGVTYRRGVPLNGYDIGAWLDDWERTRQLPLNIQFL